MGRALRAAACLAALGLPACASVPPAKAAHDAILWDAVAREATDVHFQPRQDGVHLLYRLKGRLEPMRVIRPEAVAELEKSLLSRSLLSNRTRQQHLFLTRKEEAGEVSVQVLFQPLATLQGRRLTLRILSREGIHDLPWACPRPKDRETLERWLSAPEGIILLAGKDGSGKTTTLHSCLRHLAKDPGLAVFSVEDPVWMRLDGIDQIEVDGKDAAACEAVFQQVACSAPNVLGIALDGKDGAGMRIAVRSALGLARTGHLVLIQVHAGSPGEALRTAEGWAGETLKEVLVGAAYQELRDWKGRRRACLSFLPPSRTRIRTSP